MASIFSQDNPFNDFMSTVGDMAMISIAWTICSIPVVTVGASTAAACEVARELQSGSCKGIFRSFWAAFKRRFPTTLALTAAIAAFCGLALFDLWYLSRQSTDTVAVLYGVTIVVIAVVGSALAFVLPLTGRSKLSVGEQLTHLADHRGADRAGADADAGAAAVDIRRRRSQLLGADESDPQDLLARLDSVRIPRIRPKSFTQRENTRKRRTAIWPCGVFASWFHAIARSTRNRHAFIAQRERDQWIRAHAARTAPP